LKEIINLILLSLKKEIKVL
jgi:hypothetical protein